MKMILVGNLCKMIKICTIPKKLRVCFTSSYVRSQHYQIFEEQMGHSIVPSQYPSNFEEVYLEVGFCRNISVEVTLSI